VFAGRHNSGIGEQVAGSKFAIGIKMLLLQEMIMLFKNRSNEHMVEVQNLIDLMNLNQDEVDGCSPSSGDPGGLRAGRNCAGAGEGRP